MKQATSSKSVATKKTPKSVLWGGAIIAPIVCAISVYDLVLDYETLGVFSKLWALFIIVFTGYYAYSFARDLRARLLTEKGSK